jgi:hypothetical protein
MILKSEDVCFSLKNEAREIEALRMNSFAGRSPQIINQANKARRAIHTVNDFSKLFLPAHEAASASTA